MDHFTILKNPFNLFNWSAVCTIDYGKSLGYNYLILIRKHIVKFTNHFNSCSLQGNKLDVRILFDISCLPHKCKNLFEGKSCTRSLHFMHIKYDHDFEISKVVIICVLLIWLYWKGLKMSFLSLTIFGTYKQFQFFLSLQSLLHFRVLSITYYL